MGRSCLLVRVDGRLMRLQLHKGSCMQEVKYIGKIKVSESILGLLLYKSRNPYVRPIFHRLFFPTGERH